MRGVHGYRMESMGWQASYATGSPRTARCKHADDRRVLVPLDLSILYRAYQYRRALPVYSRSSTVARTIRKPAENLRHSSPLSLSLSSSLIIRIMSSNEDCDDTYK